MVLTVIPFYYRTYFVFLLILSASHGESLTPQLMKNHENSLRVLIG